MITSTWMATLTWRMLEGVAGVLRPRCRPGGAFVAHMLRIGGRSPDGSAPRPRLLRSRGVRYYLGMRLKQLRALLDPGDIVGDWRGQLGQHVNRAGPTEAAGGGGLNGEADEAMLLVREVA